MIFEEKLKKILKDSCLRDKEPLADMWARWGYDVAKKELGSDHSYLEGVKSELKSSKQKAEIAVLEERLRVGWQPIETAPKDGTMIWVYGMCQKPIASSKPIKESQLVMVPASFEIAMWISHCATYTFLTNALTHWMPLPEPPNKINDEQTPAVTT